MSKHTPEPWRVGRPGTVVSDTQVPGIGGSDAVEYYGGHLIGESITEANARRIVACVNACVGLETEHLENQSMLGEALVKRFNLLKSEATELTKQRDELLEAICGLIDFIEIDEIKIDSLALSIARNAIAKTKGCAA